MDRVTYYELIDIMKGNYIGIVGKRYWKEHRDRVIKIDEVYGKFNCDSTVNDIVYVMMLYYALFTNLDSYFKVAYYNNGNRWDIQFRKVTFDIDDLLHELTFRYEMYLSRNKKIVRDLIAVKKHAYYGYEVVHRPFMRPFKYDIDKVKTDYDIVPFIKYYH